MLLTNRNVEERWLLPTAWEQPKSSTAGTAREKSNINNNLRKVQLGHRGGVNTHFGALLCTM